MFEVDRFDLVEDRIELAGRWSGVRGLRFMRPTLTLPVAGRRTRLLAALDHKPWSPDDGEWLASFPWDGGPVEIEGAELSVSRTLVVDLPAPGGSATAAPGPAPLPKRRFAPSSPEPEPGSRLAMELDRARAQLAEAERAREQATDSLTAARAAVTAAEAARDEAVNRATILATEVRTAVGAREEALRDRDAALRSKEAAARERDEAVSRAAHHRARPSARHGRRRRS